MATTAQIERRLRELERGEWAAEENRWIIANMFPIEDDLFPAQILCTPTNKNFDPCTKRQELLRRYLQDKRFMPWVKRNWATISYKEDLKAVLKKGD